MTTVLISDWSRPDPVITWWLGDTFLAATQHVTTKVEQLNIFFPFLINIFSGVAGWQHLQVSVDVPAAPRGRPEDADVPGGEHADGGGGAPGLVEADSPL